MKKSKSLNSGNDYIDSIKCSSCEEAFSAGNFYIQHYQSIHGGLPPEYVDKEKFMCDECPSVFMQKHRLKTHKDNVHSNKPDRTKKDFQCKFCDKKFLRGFSLKEHILREHEKSTPFQCNQCTRSFGTRSRLKTHIQLVHERVKCNECGQEMCNAFILKRHKAKVHGLKPTNAQQCKHCPLFFSRKGSLINHIAKIHPEIKEQ